MVQTSVQMTVSNSLRSHGLQHARPPCPSPTPGVTQTHVHQVSDAIQPSHPLSPSPPAFNLSQHQGLFQCQFFASSGQNIGVSALESVLPMNIQDLFPLGWTGWIPLLSKGLLRVFNTTVQGHQFFDTQLCSQSNSHPYMTTGKTIALTKWTFVGKVMSLLFNVLSSLVITFLPRSKHLLISWLQSPSAVILEPEKKKVSQFPLFPIYLP